MKLNLDGTAHHAWRPMPFLDTCSTRWAPRGFDLETKRARSAHRAHHTVEDEGSRSGRRSRKQSATRKASGGTARYVRSRTLSRVVVDLFGGPVSNSISTSPARESANSTSTSFTVLPGLRESRPRHAARRQPSRNQRAPPGGDGIQGVRARATHGRRARSTHLRGAVHERQPVVSAFDIQPVMP